MARIGKINARREWIRGVFAAQLLEPFNDRRRFFEDFFRRLVRGAENEPFAIENAHELFFRNRSHAADLHGFKTHRAHFAQRRGDVGWRFKKIAKCVKLGGGLVELHGKTKASKLERAARAWRGSFSTPGSLHQVW